VLDRDPLERVSHCEAMQSQLRVQAV